MTLAAAYRFQDTYRNTETPHDRETDGFTVEHLERAHADAVKDLRGYVLRNFARFENDFGDMGANYRVTDILDALEDTLSDVLGEAVNQVEAR